MRQLRGHAQVDEDPGQADRGGEGVEPAGGRQRQPERLLGVDREDVAAQVADQVVGKVHGQPGQVDRIAQRAQMEHRRAVMPLLPEEPQQQADARRADQRQPQRVREDIEARLRHGGLQGHHGRAEQQQRAQRGAGIVFARLGVRQQQPCPQRCQRGEGQHAVEHVLPHAALDQLGRHGGRQRGCGKDPQHEDARSARPLGRREHHIDQDAAAGKQRPAAHALHKARAHELRQRMPGGGSQRAGHEDQQRAGEVVAIAKALRQPLLLEDHQHAAHRVRGLDQGEAARIGIDAANDMARCEHEHDVLEELHRRGQREQQHHQRLALPMAEQAQPPQPEPQRPQGRHCLHGSSVSRFWCMRLSARVEAARPLSPTGPQASA